MCYCPPDTKYGRQPAPPGSPPGTPPIKQGRPLYNCHPNSDGAGKKVPWGAVPYEDLYDKEKGWCWVDTPTFQCPCRIDGMFGIYCEHAVEHSCLNQCSGHGQCSYGFCHCHEGYYGYDCSRRRQAVEARPGLEAKERPWLKPHVMPVPAALDPPPRSSRKRPLIYVYDLPPEFNSRLLQYRVERGYCMYKGFMPGNKTDWTGWTYSVEGVLHESLLLSEHRTLDPEEADFFYVPAYSTCLFEVYGKNPRPRWPDLENADKGNRPMAAANMLRAARRWISKTHSKYWQRRGGRDHIWLMAHDEGPCYAPSSIWPGIILSHWGRLDDPHRSLSQYWQDDYSKEITDTKWQPNGWLKRSSRAHPCFDPTKDLVIPSFKSPFHTQKSPYYGAYPQERDIFLFFKGDVGRERAEHDKACMYSRCIRQTLDKLVKEGEWREKYNVWYGTRQDMSGDYSELMARSKFCFHLPGDGWSSRFEESMLHGCIPVIIMDNVTVPFEGLLDVDSFSIRVKQADMPNVVKIVRGIPDYVVTRMQHNINKLWHRFRYNGIPFSLADAKDKEAHNLVENRAKVLAAGGGGTAKLQPGHEMLHEREDAVSTIIQWLHAKLLQREKEEAPAGPVAAAAAAQEAAEER